MKPNNSLQKIVVPVISAFLMHESISSFNFEEFYDLSPHNHIEHHFNLLNSSKIELRGDTTSGEWIGIAYSPSEILK